MSENEMDDQVPTEAVPAEAEALTAEAAAAEADVAAADDDAKRSATYFGWAYLAFLFALFLLLALFAYACDNDDDGAAAPVTTQAEVVSDDVPVALEFVVDGESVTLTGSVPDEGARAQLVELAEARYGDGNVVDELTIDADTTLVDGTLLVTGTAVDGDEGPSGLQADASAALGLGDGGFDVAYEQITLKPIDAEVNVATDKVVLTGVLPDQAAVDAMIEAAEDSWGAGNVDGSGLTVDSTYTLAGGRVRVTGVTDAGDTSVPRFAAAAEALGVAVENSVEIDTSADALGRLEASLRQKLEADPILFASGSADIDPVSDAILEEAAAAISAAPGIAVEIVGHTDSQGSDAVNRELSEERAQAVLDRLVELGVETERLTARGAGEDEPVADNETDEGRAANRRIAFEFDGAASDE